MAATARLAFANLIQFESPFLQENWQSGACLSRGSKPANQRCDSNQAVMLKFLIKHWPD